MLLFPATGNEKATKRIENNHKKKHKQLFPDSGWEKSQAAGRKSNIRDQGLSILYNRTRWVGRAQSIDSAPNSVLFYFDTMYWYLIFLKGRRRKKGTKDCECKYGKK